MKPKKWILLCAVILVLTLIISSFVIFKYFYNYSKTKNETVKDLIYQIKEYKVDITNIGFLPNSLEIFEGNSVIWINKDKVIHRVVSTSEEKFDSKRLYNNENYTYSFNKEGVYEYKCMYHPYETGKIIVKKIT